MEMHLISSGKQTKDELIQAIKKAHQYVDYIHLREKDWLAGEFLEVIASLVQLEVPKQKVMINDRVDIASISKVAGVQLGGHSIPVQAVKKYFPHLRIGRSVHGLKEAVAQEKAGADFLLYGHVFSTASKPGLKPRGIDSLKEVVGNTTVPVIAIGGIQPCHIPLLKESGVNGIAVLSGVLLNDDVEASAISYYQALKEGRE